MAFNVQFGKVNKARNSTKIPSLGSTVSVYLKDDTSIIRPIWRIRLGTNGAPSFSTISQYNYCYCADFKRYYFITNVTMETATVCLIACEVDVLATFRSDILATPAFVMFSQSSFNVGIPDTRLPMTARSHQTAQKTNMPFCEIGGSFVVTAVSPNNTGDSGVNASVVLQPSQMKELASKLYAEDFWSEIQTLLYRPEEALIACMWTPIGWSYAVGEGVTDIKIGQFDLGMFTNAKRRVEGKAFTQFQMFHVDLEGTDNANDFRNFEPYSRYCVYLPGVGVIEIPMTKLVGTQTTSGGTISIPIAMTASPLTGDIVYRIGYPTVLNGIEGNSVAMTVKGNFGVEVPIARTVGRYGSVIQGATGVLGGVTSGAGSGLQVGGGYGAIAGAITGGVTSAISSALNMVLSAGTFNTTMASMLNGWSVNEPFNMQIEATTINYDLSDEPSRLGNTIGRPLFKYVSSLGSLSGYVQCTGAYVKTWATNDELTLISRYVNSGNGDGGIIIE